MNEYERPWLADYQIQFIDCPERYAFIEASTKTGKTVTCIVWLFEQACKQERGRNYWWVAPINSQAEIAYGRLKRFIQPRGIFTSNDTNKYIKLINGSIVWFKSAEHPDSLYGEDVGAVVIDESTRVREEAWWAIRSTLTATKGPAKIIGNVKGVDNWAYKMSHKAERGELPDCAYFMFTAWDAVDAGILDRKEVEDARRMYPEDVFEELYECKPRNPVDSPWIYEFNEGQLDASIKADRKRHLYLSFDFNVDPCTCLVAQHTPDFIHILDEIVIRNANIWDVCNQIKAKYPNYAYLVCGDSTGRARSALSRGKQNYYQIIEKELRLNKTAIKIANNPSPQDNRVLCNAILKNHRNLKIHPECKELIEDFRRVEANPDDSINKKADARRTHILDCFRYYIHRWHYNFLKSIR